MLSVAVALCSSFVHSLTKNVEFLVRCISDLNQIAKIGQVILKEKERDRTDPAKAFDSITQLFTLPDSVLLSQLAMSTQALNIFFGLLNVPAPLDVTVTLYWTKVANALISKHHPQIVEYLTNHNPKFEAGFITHIGIRNVREVFARLCWDATQKVPKDIVQVTAMLVDRQFIPALINVFKVTNLPKEQHVSIAMRCDDSNE